MENAAVQVFSLKSSNKESILEIGMTTRERVRAWLHRLRVIIIIKGCSLRIKNTEKETLFQVRSGTTGCFRMINTMVKVCSPIRIM